MSFKAAPAASDRCAPSTTPCVDFSIARVASWVSAWMVRTSAPICLAAAAERSARGVALNIQHIMSVTEQTQDGTQQTAQSIHKLSMLAQELKNSVSRFRVAA